MTESDASTSTVQVLLQRVWQEFAKRIGTAVKGHSAATVHGHLTQAVARVIADASIDEILELVRELRTKEHQVRIAGRTPQQLIDAFLVEILTEMADVSATVVEVHVPGRGPALTAKPHSAEWQREHDFLRLVPTDALRELGERTRNMLHALYEEVTPSATDEPFRARSGDKDRVVRTFERLLWLYFLTDGFTRPTQEWSGKPLEPGAQNTPGGSYMRGEVRGRFLRYLAEELKELLKELTDEELAALARDYPFLGDLEYKGTEPVRDVQRRAFLKLLWAFYGRRKAEMDAEQTSS